MKLFKKLISSAEFWIIFLAVIYSIFAVIQTIDTREKLKAKDLEIYQLRSKINNYLLSTGAYDRKTSETLSLMKSLGIVKFYYD